MPLESGEWSSIPTWNDERTVRLFVNATTTQSPAATWSTSGSGLNAIGEAGEPLTNAPSGPFTPFDRSTSTADTVKFFTGAAGGHGVPLPTGFGGRPPVCVGGGVFDTAGVVPGSGDRSGDCPGRTRMSPHAPSRNFRSMEFS